MSEHNPNLNEDGTPKAPNPSETGTAPTGQGNDKVPANDDIDYKTKFSESSKEALRLLEEKKKAEAEVERLKALYSTKEPEKDPGTSYGNDTDGIPGFDQLGEEEQKNLLAYTNSIKKQTLNEVYKDPALAFAKQSFNEKQWGDAFEQVATQYPELRESRDEFKQKYFNPNNVPQNIADILKDLAKVHLFDKAQDLGAKRAMEQNDRIEIERAKGGDKTPTATRSIEDWNRLATENPAKFAQLSKQFDEDMASGKLK